jgi:hypothetical protein
VLLIVCVDVPHEDPEGVAAQLTQLQGAAAELKVAQLDAAQPAHTHPTATHNTRSGNNERPLPQARHRRVAQQGVLKAAYD